MQDKRTLLGGSVMGYVGNNAPPNTPPLPASQEKILDESPYRDDLGLQRNDRNLEDSIFDDVPSRAPYVPKQRLIHLDLKGAPPKISYLKKILKLSKEIGATSVLLEWEDMFPWYGYLKNVAATNAYTKEEVKDLLEAAKQNELEVIPLIQTFGHVELALKLKDFKHLREVPESAQALCPSNNASFDLIQTMIDQVMELHHNSKYLHIGCDEVFQMGECSKCKTQPRDSLFLGHVARVAGIVKTRYPSVKPIIWDDMLRHLPPSSLEQYRIGELVEPMVWVYAEDVYRFVPLPIWEKYSQVFGTVWAASAFKGAFGETLYIPNVKRHLDNNLRWLEVMANEGPKFKHGFQGIVITGWQRYDHFSVLCELLPASIPSLAITLLATSNGYMNASLRTKINNHLSCGIFAPTTYFNLNNDPFLWDTYSRCTFPGHAFFKLTNRLNSAQKEAEELIAMIRKQKGWMTKYNVRHNFSTPLRVDELMQDQPRVYHTIASLARSARDALSDVFDIITISEWVEQNIYPLVLELEEIQKDANALKARRIWPRRPFPPLKDLTRLGVQTSDDDEDIQVPPG
ncbi:hypothetical protein GE061_001626 [Apolygus lucorum]|uniref:beta-N-acetylhexosaminidase n=1 Tax=Apolygus lucorum TaxID=248454 RepID=A0A6A4KIW8_APOLU|nr:hypothetical protein GE061_001626 [Apolygus lucorum]